jgi:hypothetical protein
MQSPEIAHPLKGELSLRKLALPVTLHSLRKSRPQKLDQQKLTTGVTKRDFFYGTLHT